MSDENQDIRVGLEEKIKAAKSGAHWFYWIAGLSVINSASLLTGNEWGFVIGLGITQIFDAIGLAVAESVGGAAKILMFLFTLVASGVTALFGYFGTKLKSWAFVVGMVLYGLDGLLVLAFMDWIGAGFHAFAFYFIFTGFKHCRELNAVAARLPSAAPGVRPNRLPAVPSAVETS